MEEEVWVPRTCCQWLLGHNVFVCSDLINKFYPFEVKIPIEKLKRYTSSGICGRTDSGRR
jgi:hypothetical protein